MDKIALICLELDFSYADLMEMIRVQYCPIIWVEYDPVTPNGLVFGSKIFLGY